MRLWYEGCKVADEITGTTSTVSGSETASVTW